MICKGATVIWIGFVDGNGHFMHLRSRTEYMPPSPHCLQSVSLFFWVSVILPKTNLTQKLDTVRTDSVSYKVVLVWISL